MLQVSQQGWSEISVDLEERYGRALTAGHVVRHMLNKGKPHGARWHKSPHPLLRLNVVARAETRSVAAEG